MITIRCINGIHVEANKDHIVCLWRELSTTDKAGEADRYIYFVRLTNWDLQISGLEYMLMQERMK